MKLTHTRKTTRKAGMTLLELTVVILVLLSLISILFIGARAWKRGSDRAGCIMNIRNVQQAVRGYQNMYGLGDGVAPTTDGSGNAVPGQGASLPTSKIIGAAAGYLENPPTCPGGGTYSYIERVPALGELYATCSLATTLEHEPTSHADW